MNAIILAGLMMVPGQVRDPEFRVGRIAIEGNTSTPNRVILSALRMAPGQRSDLASVRAAERRLADLGLFRSNPWRGVGPKVRVAPSGADSGLYLDLIVTVQERP